MLLNKAGLVEKLQHHWEVGKAEAPQVSKGQVEGRVGGGLSWPYAWMLLPVFTYHKGRSGEDAAAKGWGAHKRCL